MSELKKFDFVAWAIIKREIEILSFAERKKIEIAVQACSEHYEKQWNTRPEPLDVGANNLLEDKAQNKQESLNHAKKELEVNGEFVRKSDIENKLKSKKLFHVDFIGRKFEAIPFNITEFINTLETHSVPSEGFKVGDEVWCIYRNNLITRGTITKYKCEETQEEIKENEYKITRSYLFLIRLLEIESSKTRFATDKIYKTRAEAEQALAEGKGESK